MNHNMAALKSIMVYTRGVASEGGGGRRVSMELLHNFNALGVYAYAWSLLPLFPERLYDGRYRFDAYHLYDDWDMDPESFDQATRRHLAAEILAHLRFKRPSWILFDTEYSYREFQFLMQGDTQSLPPLAVLVHDQLWKRNIGYLSAFTSGKTARLLGECSPYPELIRYTERLLSRIRRRHILPVIERAGKGGLSSLGKLGISLKGYLAELKQRICWPWRNNRYTMGFFRELEGVRAVKRDLGKADAIFCLTRRSAQESAAGYALDPSRVFVSCGFYDPCDALSDSEPRYRKQFGTGTRKVLLAFSRISWEKNLELILLSFSQACRVRTDMQLWIAGLITEEHRPYAEALMQYATALGLQESCFLLGSVNDEEMQALYAESDAFICAQVGDFNLSVYNALRFFKPVVVSRAYDFAPELADAQAILCDNRTVEDFAGSILKALHTPLAFSERERQYVLSLSFENYARAVMDGMASVVSSEEVKVPRL